MGVTAVRAGGWVFLHIVENIETEEVLTSGLQGLAFAAPVAACLCGGVLCPGSEGWRRVGTGWSTVGPCGRGSAWLGSAMPPRHP